MKLGVKIKGFTLIEMLLVLTIISAIVYGSITYMQQRTTQTMIDRTTSQMQQLLAAGLSYYAANSLWPTSLACLQGGAGAPCQVQYVPNVASISSNPWGNPYKIASSGSVFYVYTAVPPQTGSGTGTPSSYASSVAASIAGSLPLSYTANPSGVPPADIGTPCGTGAVGCRVVTSVNTPPTSIQNLGSVNFAGIYHHGGCIPVPTCPITGTQTSTPEVIVAPVSVTGVNSNGSTNSYPITSFSAYVVGPATNPPACVDTGGEVPVACQAPSGTTTTKYWRACLDVVTQLGDVAATNTTGNPSQFWGQYVTLMAITRCAISGENPGSPYTSVYSN